MRSRTSPELSAGPHLGRGSSRGKFPYGLWPVAIRSAPITPEYPTSITFEDRQFNPTRKPARKTVADASTHTGQTNAARGGWSLRATHTQRTSSQTSGGYASGIAAKMLPRLKKHSDTDSEGSPRRAALRVDNRRRPPAGPGRNNAPRPRQTPWLVIFLA